MAHVNQRLPVADSLTKSVRFLTYAIASSTCSSKTKGGGGAKEYLSVSSWTLKASSCVYLRSIWSSEAETLSVYRRVDGVLVATRAPCASRRRRRAHLDARHVATPSTDRPTAGRVERRCRDAASYVISWSSSLSKRSASALMSRHR